MTKAAFSPGLVAAAILPAVLLAGCSTGGPETRLATAETSVKAEIVRKQSRVFTDRGWRDQVADSVIVHRLFSPVEFGTVCRPGVHNQPELSLDARGERVAYRCAAAEPWHIHYLKTTDARTFHLCAPLQQMSWDTVPVFEQARLSFLECGTAAAGEADNSFKQIFEESFKRGGARDAAVFLLSTAALSFSTPHDPHTGDDWTRAYGRLPEGERDALNAQLLDRAAAAPSDLLAYRALLCVDAALLAARPDLLANAARHASRNTNAEDESFSFRWRTLDIALRILAGSKRKEAAAIACKAASSFAANGRSRILPRIQMALIADQKLPCDLDGVFDRSVCGATYACCSKGFTCADASRRPCSSVALKNLIETELGRDAQNPWPPGSTSGDELLVAAAREQQSASAREFLARISAAPECK